ncbi:MAG: class I tRNA ligase family protein [Kiritimatiellia bacterium]
MSKSRGNVVNPDDVIKAYGADSLRLYEMFMGPLEQVKPWSMKGVEGVHRFLNRVYRWLCDEETGVVHASVGDHPATVEQQRALHQTIRKVGEDIEAMRFNTAISAMMEFLNAATRWEKIPRGAASSFLLLLAPFAPHLAEELWGKLGHSDSLAHEPWPVHDEALLKLDQVEIPVQVNGKLRGKLTIAPDAAQAAVVALAIQLPAVMQQLEGKVIRKEIFVTGKMLNLVAD